MAGWLIVWSGEEQPMDRNRWTQSVRAAGRYGEAVQEKTFEKVHMAVWRRNQGEFPHSGTIIRTSCDSDVAWIGQCLEDSGDVSIQAAESLAGSNPDFRKISDLNGPFAAAVVRNDPFSVTVWTDRFSHYPIYMYKGEKIRVASTAIRCVIPWIVDLKMNLASVDMMLRTSELIDRMTMIEGVEFLPGGICIRDDGKQVTEHQYWRYELDPDFSVSRQAYAERYAEAITAATRRFEATCPRLGVPLSGGLDSRLCLGLCRNPKAVPSFTWGSEQCRDVRYAKKYAQLISSPHHVRLLDPQAFVPVWSQGVDLTGGSFGAHVMFVLPFVGLLSRHCDVVLNGLAGDGILGGSFLRKSWMREKSLETAAETSWRWRVSPLEDAWVNRLVGIHGKENPSRRRWVESILKRPLNRPVDRMNSWLSQNRLFRFTNCGTMLLRSGVESHTIFFDRYVIDLIRKTPVEYKWKHRLYFDIINRACPSVGKVRWQRSWVPPAWGFWANFAGLAVQRGIRMAVKPFKIDPFPGLQVADLAKWFRREWSVPARQILFSERFMDRGVVDPDALRELWLAHQKGADLSRQLGMMISLELFMRMAIDGEDFKTAGVNE